ncbi:MAG: dihydropteroate synthase [Bacteroidales bacterium]|nr:dihydropteroate synthase [Bacteroidales bacterium]
MNPELQKQSLFITTPTNRLNLKVPVVMGIVNLTTDSFYSGNRFLRQNYLVAVDKMLEEGAAIIDLGALSTRPGSKGIGAEEEIKRLETPLKEIRKTFPDTTISVDTYLSAVAKWAAELGADMINDISGGTIDDEMIPVMAKLNIPYVIMHMQGTPANMQISPVYQDVIREVGDFFSKQIHKLKQAGFTADIILDPGFGFGKTVDHNFRLLSGLNHYTKLGLPILAGTSRKSMINKVLLVKPESALNGTTVINTMALLNGANILRVHDVKEAVEAVKLFQQYKKSTNYDEN